jgi:hypothetical protein
VSTVPEKAATLVAAGAVTEIPGRLYIVAGEHSPYLVTVPDSPVPFGQPLAACRCKAGRENQTCSHALAALTTSIGAPA